MNKLLLFLLIILGACNAVDQLGVEQYVPEENSANGSSSASNQVNFTQTSQAVGEGIGTVQFSVTLNRPIDSSLVVPFTYNSSSINGVHFNNIQPASGSIVFNAGEIQKTLSVDIIDNNIKDGIKLINFSLLTPSLPEVQIGSLSSYSLSILDDDTSPILEFTSISQSINENAGTTISVTVNSTSPMATNVLVPIVITGTATAGVDYTNMPLTILIPQGGTTGTKNITIADDGLGEGNETIIITLGSSGSGEYILGNDIEHTITIVDDEALPIIGFGSPASATVENLGATINIPVVVSATPYDNNITVPYSVAGTATTGVDHNLLSGTLVIPAGSPSADINITITDDMVFEGNETVVITLGQASRAIVNSLSAQYTLTIQDDETPPQVSLQAGTLFKTEPSNDPLVGSSGSIAELIVVASSASEIPIVVGYSILGTSTATIGTDHDLAANGVIIIPPGATQGAKQFRVLHDDMDEFNETINVQLTAPISPNYTTVAPLTKTIQITDNDNPPDVSFYNNSIVVNEQDLNFPVQVSLSQISGKPVTVNLSSISGTATMAPTPGSDFNLPGGWNPSDSNTWNITIPAGQLTAQAVFGLANDNINEADESILINMNSTAINANVVNPNMMTVLLKDDEILSTVSFNTAASTFNEAAGTVSVQIDISNPSSTPIKVPILAISGNAEYFIEDVQEGDFKLPTGWVAGNPITWEVTIPANATSANLDFEIIDDHFYDPNEFFILQIGDPLNAQAAGQIYHQVNITDNEAVPNLEFAVVPDSYTDIFDNIVEPKSIVPEGNGYFDIVVKLTPPVPDPNFAGAGADIELQIGMNSGLTTATIGNDFVLPNGWNATPDATWRIKIPKGQKFGYVRFALNNDTNLEVNELAVFQLNSANQISYAGAPSVINYAFVGTSDFSVTIQDNDPIPTASFQLLNQATNEANTTITAKVVLSGANETADVDVAFSYSGTATYGTDYTITTPSPLTFLSGETQKDISIVINDDTDAEANESVVLSLAAASAGVNVNTGTNHTLMILDNEQLPRVEFATGLYGSATQIEDTPNNTVTVVANIINGITSSADIDIPISQITGSADINTDIDLPAGWIANDPNTWKIKIPAGSTTGSVVFTLLDDNMDEPQEFFRLYMGPPANATLASLTQTRVDIFDNDTPSTVSFALVNSTFSESQGEVEVKAVLDRPSGYTITVPWAAASPVLGPGQVLALPGVDILYTPGVLVFQPGQTEANFKVTLIDNSNFDQEKLIAFTLSSSGAQNVTVAGTPTHYLSILDDDPLPTISFEYNFSEVKEPFSGYSTVQVRVVTDAISYQDIRVPISVIESSAQVHYSTVAPIDIDTVTWDPNNNATHFFVIPAGSSESAYETFRVHADTPYEIEESLELIMGTPIDNNPPNSVAGVIGANPIHYIYIEDVGPKPQVYFSQSSQIETEGPAATATVQVNSTRVSDYPIVVPFTSIAGAGNYPATYSDDYTLPANWVTNTPSTWKETIPAGSTAVQFDVPIVDDIIVEPLEQLDIQMGLPYSVTPNDNTIAAGGINKHTIYIADGGDPDTPPIVYFPSRTQWVNESTGGVDINVSMSHQSAYDVIVNYKVVVDTCFEANDADRQITCGTPGSVNNTTQNTHATAEQGVDFISYNGSFTIPAGQTLVQLPTMPILDDGNFEYNERFTIEITSVSNGSFAAVPYDNSYATTITIVNDDSPPFVDFDLSEETGYFIDLDNGISYQTVYETQGVDTTVTVKYMMSGTSVEDTTIYFTAMGTATKSVNCGALWSKRDFSLPGQDILGTDCDFYNNNYDTFVIPAVIPAGQTVGEFTFKVHDDFVFEDDESIIFSIYAVDNGLNPGVVGLVNTHVVTIVDTDPVPDPFIVNVSTTVREPKLCTSDNYKGLQNPILSPEYGKLPTLEGTAEIDCDDPADVGISANYTGIKELRVTVRSNSVMDENSTLITLFTDFSSDAIPFGDFVPPGCHETTPGSATTQCWSPMNPGTWYIEMTQADDCYNNSGGGAFDGSMPGYCEKDLIFHILDDEVYESQDDISITIGQAQLLTGNSDLYILPSGNSNAKTANISIMNDEQGIFTKWACPNGGIINGVPCPDGDAAENDPKPKVWFTASTCKTQSISNQCEDEKLDGSDGGPTSDCTLLGGHQVNVSIEQDRLSSYQTQVFINTRSFTPDFSYSAADRSTAEPGVDHDFVPGTAIIDIAQAYGDFGFCIFDDKLTEGDEKIEFTMSTPINATLAAGNASKHTVFINHSDPAQLAVGANHVCALMSEQVKCWGNNSYGQLGVGNTASYDTPPSGFINFGVDDQGQPLKVKKLVAGADFNCALFSNNDRVKCWGRAAEGRLGVGYSVSNPNIGDSVSELGNNLQYITFKIDPNTSQSMKVLDISATNRHACAVLDDKGVYCWGDNTYGQLGQGNTQDYGLNYTDMQMTDKVPVGFDAKSVIAGGYYSCAYGVNNEIKCWGRGSASELGGAKCSMRGSETYNYAVYNDLGVSGTNIYNTAVQPYGGTHVYLDNRVCLDGTMPGPTGVSCSSLTYDHLAPYDYYASSASCENIGDTALEVEKFSLDLNTVFMKPGMHNTPALSISAGFYNACADHGGQFTCWGHNSDSQLGRGHNKNIGRSAMQRTYSSDFQSIFDGYSSFAYEHNAPNIVSGTPTSSLPTAPTPPFVEMPSSSFAEKIVFGYLHSCTLLDTGEIRCLGENASGQRGRNNSSAVVSGNKFNQADAEIIGLDPGINFVDIAANARTTCAVVKSNEIFCWGNNSAGQLGIGNTNDIGSNSTIISSERMQDGHILAFPEGPGSNKCKTTSTYAYTTCN